MATLALGALGTERERERERLWELTAPCIVCGSEAPYVHDPQFCSSCEQQPLSTEDIRRRAFERLGIEPLGVHMPFVGATVPGEAFGSRYRSMAVVLMAIPHIVAARGTPEELARARNNDTTAAVTLTPATWLPLRTLVFFRDTSMWLELLWHGPLGNHQLDVHRFDVAGLVEPGKNGKTRSGPTMRRFKLATDLFRFTPAPGRPPNAPATAKEIESRSNLVEQAVAYKERNPEVTWAQIAKFHLGLSPGQLDHARRASRLGRSR